VKKLLIILLILAISVWVGAEIATNPGYVLIAGHHWTAEMPLWVAISLFILLFVVLHYLSRLVRGTIHLPQRFYHWMEQRQQRRAEEKTNQHLLSQILQQPKDWNKILSLLPQLHKRKLLSDEHIQTLVQQSHQERLQQSVAHENMAALKRLWETLPNKLQKDNNLLKHYIKGLIKHSHHDEADDLIRKALKKHWDEHLVYLYGLIPTTHANKRLKTAEDWLKSHPKDPNLLLTLGRICMQNQLWGKARSYFEASLAQKPQAETYLALGKLLEQLGERDNAMECYKKALVIS